MLVNHTDGRSAGWLALVGAVLVLCIGTFSYTVQHQAVDPSTAMIQQTN